MNFSLRLEPISSTRTSANSCQAYPALHDELPFAVQVDRPVQFDPVAADEDAFVEAHPDREFVRAHIAPLLLTASRRFAVYPTRSLR